MHEQFLQHHQEHHHHSSPLFSMIFLPPSIHGHHYLYTPRVKKWNSSGMSCCWLQFSHFWCLAPQKNSLTLDTAHILQTHICWWERFSSVASHHRFPAFLTLGAASTCMGSLGRSCPPTPVTATSSHNSFTWSDALSFIFHVVQILCCLGVWFWASY